MVMGQKAQLTLKIYGRVQGVFFRAETARQARSLGLVGKVRYAEDGTVEIVAEGNRGDLERLLKWCQRGPSVSRVEKVGAEWEEYKGDFETFSVSF